MNMRRPAPILSAFAVILLLAAGCGGRSAKQAYELPPPAPPGEDKPQDEVSQNLALALGAKPNSAASLEARRATLPKELVGDQQNAEYSGERLTGSVATRAPAVSPAAVPPAHASSQVAPAAPAAPKAAPRVAVESLPAPTAPVPAAPVPAAPKPTAAPASPKTPMPAPAASPAAPAAPPAAPSAVVASAATAGQTIAQIAAFRTRANAEGGWQRLRAAHPDLLGDRALILHEVDLGERGIYYRVRTGPFADTASAKAFCEQLRARDQGCVVISPN